MNYLEQYDWPTLLATAQKAPPTGCFNGYNDDMMGSDWFGGITGPQAIELATTGAPTHTLDTDDTEAARICHEAIVTSALNTEFEQTYDVAGDEVDIARYLAGEPENMSYAWPAPIARAGRVVRLVVPMAVSSNTPPDTIVERGKAILAVADALKRAGHGLELWLESTIMASDATSTDLICVQPADSPLDLGRVEFALTHPAMFRRIQFGVMEQRDSKYRETFDVREGGRGSYGSPRQMDYDDIPTEWEGATVLLPQLRSYWDASNTKQFIDEVIATLTGEQT